MVSDYSMADGIMPLDDRDLIHYATLAPSSHNTQPWLFTQGDRCIHIHADRSRRLLVVDPDDHALFISLGCALENLAIAARCAGLVPRIVDHLMDDPPTLSVYLDQAGQPVDPSDRALLTAMVERQSTRCAYNPYPIPVAHLERLKTASHEDGVHLHVAATPEAIAPFIPWVQQANRQQFSDRAFVEELMAWIRFSRREVRHHQDGIPGPGMGMPFVPRWLGQQLMAWFATPESQANQVTQRIHQSSALLLFVVDSSDRAHWVALGRSLERVVLTATQLNIRHAHLNMPCEVPAVRSQMQQHFNLEQAQPLILLRLGYSNPMPRSPRRPLNAVIQTNVSPPQE
jgi:hypothetical protein